MVSLLRVHAVRGHRLSLCPQSVRGGSENTMWPPRPWAETTLWVQTVYRSITKSLPWLVQATLPGTQIIITRGQNQVSKGKRRNLDTKASKKNCPVSGSVTETSCTLSGYTGLVMENSLGWGRWQNVRMMTLQQDNRKPSTDPPNPLTHAGKVRRDRWVNVKNFLQHTRV